VFAFVLTECFPRHAKALSDEARANTIRYIQEENKENLSAIATNNAQIMSDAVKITADAVKDGMRATKFCKHCGEKIDEESKFCSSCGKEQ